MTIPLELQEAVCERWSKNLPIRRTLPEQGRLHIDRQLPFLCLYRRLANASDPGTERLVLGEAAYMIAPSAASHRRAVKKLILSIASMSIKAFGAFLLVEVWAGPEDGKSSDPANPAVQPKFQVFTASHKPIRSTVDQIVERLDGIRVLKQTVAVEIIEDAQVCPEGFSPIFSKTELRKLNLAVIGIAVPPVYRTAKLTKLYPRILKDLRHDLSLVFKNAFFDYSQKRTLHHPVHYHEMGRRAVVKAVWDVDKRLVAVDNQFDFLLQLNPVNSYSSWELFRGSRFQKVPEFHYRPANFDPALLKRQLFQIPFERVEDPALHHIFHEKAEELDRKISMLSTRDTPRFLFSSLQQFGPLSDSLLKLAEHLLAHLPPPEKKPDSNSKSPLNDHHILVAEAEAEIACYRQQFPDFTPSVVSTSRVSGIMVSRGKLFINNRLKASPARRRALIQHEIGTHLLTWYNGRAQPFKLLSSGLADYERLQEGISVLAEYLVDGLTCHRVRQLAARVVAVEAMVRGGSFIDIFRLLTREYGFPGKSAFNISLRIFRGGGLTKDAVYLDGLSQVLSYLGEKGDFETLLIGKVSLENIPVIRELRYRNIIQPPKLQPRYLADSMPRERLQKLSGRTEPIAEWIVSAVRSQNA